MDDFPTIISLDQDDFPEIGDCKVGESYTFDVTVTMVSKTEGATSTLDGDPNGDADQIRGTFKVTDVSYDDDDKDQRYSAAPSKDDIVAKMKKVVDNYS